jgi:hypothetical protein
MGSREGGPEGGWVGRGVGGAVRARGVVREVRYEASGGKENKDAVSGVSRPSWPRNL